MLLQRGARSARVRRAGRHDRRRRQCPLRRERCQRRDRAGRRRRGARRGDRRGARPHVGPPVDRGSARARGRCLEHGRRPRARVRRGAARGERSGRMMSARPGYLFVLPWSLESIGGVSVAVRGIATAMRRQERSRPIVMVLDWRSRRVTRMPEPDLDVCSFLIPDPLGQSRWRTRTVALLVALPLSMLGLAAFLRRENVEVVNFHYPGLQCLAVLLLRAVGLYRGRIVLSFHGRDVTAIREETRPLRRRLWRLALARVDASVACSESLAKEVASLEGAAAGRVEVIGNGVDSSAIRRMASVASGAPQLGRPYVLCLATYEHKKGLDV